MLTRRRFAGLSVAALAAGCASGPISAPDILLYGGPIYTGLARTPRVEALRLSGGRVAFAGALDEARAGGGVRFINLDGAAAFPGFIDSHVHLMGVGVAALTLDLVGTPSIAALRDALAAYARAHPQGAILGRGWIETHWPERRFPNRADLDAVVADRPVILERIDGHAAVANSAALALAGIDNNTPDPAGGAIERDAAGVATGMLIDNAASAVQARFPPPTPSQQREALAQAARLYASRGWTGVSNVSTTSTEEAAFRDLAANGELPLWAALYMEPDVVADAMSRQSRIAPGGRVQVLGVKVYMDGALGSRGAALLAPYADAAGDGLLVTPVDVIRAQMLQARQGNYQVAAHAIGDRGNRLVLDAFRDVFADSPNALRAARWRVEHAQVVAPDDLQRFAQMGVIASMQPSHAISDLYFAPARLGPDRLVGAYAWRTLLESGAMIAAGSDAPVERGDPLIEFYAAAYRHALNGFAGPDWRLQEAVSRAQALHMLTLGGAFATYTEQQRGTLEVGKFADVSVFSADLMQAPFEQVRDARAVLTICEGAVTHQAL